MLLVTASNNLSCTEDKQTLFLFLSLLNPRSTYNNITLNAQSSSQVLYEFPGRSGNAGVGADDQHGLIIPEPQPRTAASHCGLDNVSNAKKYKKSHRAFWESQDIVHAVTFSGAMVVYNRTITEKIYNKLFHELGDTPLRPMGREALQAQEPLEDAPSSLEQSYTILRKKKYILNEVQQLQFYEQLRNNKKSLRAQGDPLRPPEESHSKSGSLQGHPGLHHTNSMQTTSNAQGKTCYKNYK